MMLIEIVISPAGETTLQTRGFQGDACQQASRGLEQALGLVARAERTAEYYAPPTQLAQEQHER